MKKIKILLVIVLFLVIGTIGGTVAYYTIIKEVKNEFQALTFNVDIEEDSSDGFGKKVVDIINKDNTPVVVRVSYNEVWSKNDNQYGYFTLNNIVNGVNVVNKEWSTTWQYDFILGQDGWYYYKKILNAGSRINLIKGISLNNDAILKSADRNDYLNYGYELNFGFEAIQATEEAVKDLWGIDVNFNGDEIKWF